MKFTSVLATIWDITKTTTREWWNDDVFRLSSSIAFYTIFSLAPILLISVGVASLFFSQQSAQKQIVQEIENLTGGEGGKIVEQVIQNMQLGQSPKAIIIGIFAVVIGSTAVFVNLQSSLNHIWHVEPSPNRSMWKRLLRDRLRSFGIVLVVGFLLLVSMIVSAFLSGAQQHFADQMNRIPHFWYFLNSVVAYVIITFLFAMIYKYLPDVKIGWGDVLIGAAITAALFTAGKYMIGFYLGQVAIGSTYGAAGSFVVFLIWIYYTLLICFFGAEFTQVYAKRMGSRIAPEDTAVRVDRECEPEGASPNAENPERH